MTTIQQRVKAANNVIGNLAQHGPRLLYSPADDRAGRLGLDRYGQLWYVDHFTGMMLYPFEGNPWHGFTGGPELRAIVTALANYGRNGVQVDLALIEQACAHAYSGVWGIVRELLTANEAVAGGG